MGCFNLGDIENILLRYRKLLLCPVVGVELEFYLSMKTSVLPDFIELGIYQIVEEKGVGQFEAKFQHTAQIARLIDNIERFTDILDKEFGAIFAAKPFLDKPGSAMHINLSILDRSNNNVFSADRKFFLNAVAGLCMLIPNSMTCFAPFSSCYLRYQQCCIHTPNTISWGMNNRTVAIRSPDVFGQNKNRRIEHRLPCADCSPADSIAAVLLAACYGMEHEIMPAAPAIYGVASDSQYNVSSVPLTIEEARKHTVISELLAGYYRL